MPTIPPFGADGLLPPSDYEVTFDELRASILASGPEDGRASRDATWRLHLIDNIEILSRQLWQVGVREIFADGSFAEDKDHPNDIDGYFECSLDPIRTGGAGTTAQPHRPLQSLDLGPSNAAAIPWLSEEAATDVASVPG